MSNPDASHTRPDPSTQRDQSAQGDLATQGDPAPQAEQVVREVELSAPTDVVWAVLNDPDELAEWLGGEVDLELEPGAVGRVTDPDGTVRQVLVIDVVPGQRLGWHWWSDDDELSSVELVIEPLEGDRTRIRVTETLTADVEPSRRDDMTIDDVLSDGLVIDGFSPMLGRGDTFGGGPGSGPDLGTGPGPIAPQASVRSFALAGV